MTQPTLFDRPTIAREPVRARRTDGPGSHEAADRMQRTGAARAQAALVLEAVTRWPWRSSRQLSELSGIDRYVAARRLPELEREGMVARKQPAKGPALWGPR